MGGVHVNDDALHGSKVLLVVVLLHVNTTRIFCAHRYFTSVSSVDLLHMSGLKCISVVKIATKTHHMTYSGSIDLEHIGDRFGLIIVK